MGGDASLPASFAGCVVRMGENGVQTFLYASDKVDVVTGTKPVTLFFNAEEYRLNGEWKNLPAQVCLALERACPGRLRMLVARGEVAGFATSEARFRRGQYVPEAQVWYEKNAPSREFVRQTRKLCILFGADLSHIKVTYVANGADESKTANRDAIFEAARRGRRALPGSVGAGDLNHEVVAAFEADLMESYADGFDFRETSRRLVEGRVGKAMTEAVAKALQARMFERKDGVWLFPQMVMDDAARVKMTARAKELLANEGAFALDALRDEFEDEIRNVPSGADFKRFFNAFVADAVGGRVRGHEGWRVCFAAGTSEAAGWAAIADRVRDVLASAGDALSIADILAQLPHLDREVILRVCQESVKDAVVFTLDEIEYVKLLESFYLPEDFGDTLSAFVAETEADQGVVTRVLLENALDAKYGDGFRANFGLEDDEAFKQIIEKSFPDTDRVWKGDVFSAAGSRVFRNVADEFVNVRKGVFHEEEFFKFALDTRGLDNHASLICQYLRTRCVRLNKTMWIGLSDFQNRAVLDNGALETVKQFLVQQLGNASILHIGLIPTMAFDALSPMVIDDMEYHWNAYSVTSVARHLIKDLNLVNDEPSPYYVTAMLLPKNVQLTNDDVVDHVFEVCRASGAVPQSADEAFDYLKDRQVRMMKTAKLMEKIKTFWSF